jgi:flagellar hook-associated protein 3 FlgL
MSILPIQSSRVGNLLRADVATTQIDQTEQQLLTTQEQISTGKRLNQPSDDPGDSSVVMQLQKTLDSQNQYMKNVQQSQSQLGEVDSTLSNLTDLVTQATTIASQNVGSEVSDAERQSAANVVQTLYSQAMQIGNTQFEGSYLFGGDKSNAQPFTATNSGVQFVGSTTLLQNSTASNTLAAFQVSATTVFGAMSAGVTGTADLTPSLATDTRIIDLRGASGNGVNLGTIQIGNGTTSKPVNLSNADSVGDVVNAINNAGIGGITASISGNHLALSTSGTDNITVNDVGGGTTAADLGILKTTGGGAGAPVTGASVQPSVTPLTQLTSLNNGAGIDTTHGLVITNGQASATINLSGAHTVEDLLNAINSSGVSVQARINSAGTGIDIMNPVQGTQMTIGENGGTTAADLGVRSFSPSTPLSELNGGKGPTLATSGPDFQVTRSDGTTFGVSLTGAKTIADVIGDINTAAGGTGVTASFATTGNGIVLTDTAGGPGTLTVTPQNFSSAASDLGLDVAATGNVIKGSDANPVQTQGLFADLANLQKALNANDQTAITAAGAALQSDHDRIVAARGQAGGQVQAYQNLQSAIQDQTTATTALISQLQDADMPSVISQYSTLQTALQATLQVSARAMSLSLMDFLA